MIQLDRVVARLTEKAATSGVEDFVASAKKFGAKVKESNGLVTITISDTKKATQFRSQYVDSKGRILDRKTWSKVQGEGPVKGGGAYWEVKAGLQQNKVVARLTERSGKAESSDDVGKVSQYFPDPDQLKLVQGLARVMKESNWSTTQREDALAITKDAKLTASDMLAAIANLISFSQEVIKELRDIQKEIKQA